MTRTLIALSLALTLGACAEAPAPDVSTDGVDTERTEATDQVAPPTAIAEAFASAHPSASEVEWSMEAAGYEASFVEGGEDLSIVYAADGTPGAVETEIAVADLPAAVAATLARDHAGHPVTEAARIVADGVSTYEAEVRVDGATQDLIFAEDGTLLETIAAESD